jgi:hypothetical protein
MADKVLKLKKWWLGDARQAVRESGMLLRALCRSKACQQLVKPYVSMSAPRCVESSGERHVSSS